jgi:hypothetical protein
MDVLVKNSVDVTVPKTPLLRFHQRDSLNQEIQDIDSSLDPQNPFKHRSGPDVAEARSRAKRLKKQLHDYSPNETTGGLKDKLAARAKVLEDRITAGMPSQEEMRKNPAGMVGRHMRWEKANKKDILEWKNIQIMLEPDSSDPDIANFERLRPSGEMDRLRTDAQIGGHMTYGNIPESVWKALFPNGPDSALEQAKRVQAEQDEKIDKRKLPRTEEQKRILAERLALARATKAKDDEPVSPPIEGESVPFEGA